MASIIARVTYGQGMWVPNQQEGTGSCLAELEGSHHDVAAIEAKVGYLHHPNSFGVSVISTPFFPSIRTSSSIRTPSFPLR